MERIYMWLQIALALFALFGVLHSVYRGTIGELIDNTRRIPNVETQVEEIEDKQEDMADAIVLLGHSQVGGGVEPDPGALERDLRDEDEGPGRYARSGFYSFEDEEEEVTEP